jgi:hypothetical protein
VISTYGRGLYILDDITPLEQMAKSHPDPAATVLFEPRQAYRFTRGSQAFFHFSVKTAPKDPIDIEILDVNGKVIRKLKFKARAGMNRVKWDLRHESPKLVALRTTAPENSHIWNEPRFRDTDSRPITHWGARPAEVGPIVAPGTYTVRLKLEGQSYTQPITVVRDPHSPGADADIAASVKTLLQITEDITTVSNTINQIEWLRKQLEVIEAMLRPPKKKPRERAQLVEADDEYDAEPEDASEQAPDTPEAKRKVELLKTVEAMDQKLKTIEYKLVSPALENSDDKYFVEPYRAYLNLIWLNAEVGTGGGDVAGGADFPPTDTQLATLHDIETEMSGATAELQKLLKEDLPAFNRVLGENNVALVAASSTESKSQGGN